MTSEQHGSMDRELAKRLEGLVKESLDRGPESVVRPSEEAMLAYVNGHPTTEQEAEVRTALLQSRHFREEFIELVRDIESLEGAEAQASFEAVAVPEMPAHLKALVRSPHAESENVVTKFWGTFRRSLPVDRAPSFRMISTKAPALGAVLVRNLWASPDPMTPGQFIPVRVRGADESTVSPTAEEAARRRFLEQVQNVEGGLRMLPDRAESEGIVSAKTLTLRLFDQDGQHLKTLRASVPAKARNAQAWFLLLPSLDVRAMDMPSDSLAVIWEADLAARGCATFTYEVDGEYEATRGVAFTIGNAS